MKLLTPLRSLAYRKYKELETEEHKLRYLFLEITRQCNLNCRHCGSDCSQDSSMATMPTEKWLEIIDELKSIYAPYFVITGGEPLVHPDLDVITSQLKKRRAQFGMVTNGMALTESKLDSLISNGLTSITLSLDGNEASHLYIRKHPESWNRVVEAMKVIGNSVLPVKEVVTCVTPSNLETLGDTAELLIESGITHWRLFRIFPKGAAQNHPALMLSFEESNQMVQWIAENRSTYDTRGLKLSFSCEGYLPFDQDRLVRDEPFFCRAGVSIASILADGSITGCNNNCDQFYQGNINEDNFSEIWSQKFTEYRDHTWKKTGICSDCKKWNNCLGGSIHLRDKMQDGPDFCYVKDVMVV